MRFEEVISLLCSRALAGLCACGSGLNAIPTALLCSQDLAEFFNKADTSVHLLSRCLHLPACLKFYTSICPSPQTSSTEVMSVSQHLLLTSSSAAVPVIKGAKSPSERFAGTLSVQNSIRCQKQFATVCLHRIPEMIRSLNDSLHALVPGARSSLRGLPVF